MSARVRSGLIAGAGGLLLTLCIGLVVGLCGPLGGVIAGGVAGLLTVRGQPAISKSSSAKDGAIAGGIAGALCLLGQIIGSLTTLLIMPGLLATTGAQMPFGGQMPTPGDPVTQTAYYASGIGVGICIGVVGAALAAGAGALVAYLMTPDQPAAPPPPMPAV